MSFRTVIVKNRCKLEYSLNYMVYRTADQEKRILLDEISTIMIETNMACLTSALISEVSQRNIKLIFCDSKSNPICETLSYYGSYDSFSKLVKQYNFDKEIVAQVWSVIVKEKIVNQSKVMRLINEELANKLLEYTTQIIAADASNREGHAAKVYFNGLFGKDFSREQDRKENKYLDYGYTILLSSINRSVKLLGYYTELGIHHIGKTNPFNVSCDLIEPLRPIIDAKIVKQELTEENFKKELVGLLETNVICDNQTMFLENAIKTYVQSVFSALDTGQLGKIKFIEYAI